MSSETRNSSIGVHDVKANLAKLLDRIQRGEVIVITRHGTPVARLVPFAQPVDQALVGKAIDGIRRLRRRLSLDGLRVEDLINEGRNS